MNINRLSRKIHIWSSILTLIPLLLFSGSGIFLLLKKEFTWIQPKTYKGVSKVPSITFDDILESSKSVDEGKIKNWKDIVRLDVRPSKGVVKVRNRNGYEIQIDLKTAEVLHSQVRRSDTIEAIHDGSYFSNFVKYYIFLPSSVLIFIASFTGLYLFILPFMRRRRK